MLSVEVMVGGSIELFGSFLKPTCFCWLMRFTRWSSGVVCVGYCAAVPWKLDFENWMRCKRTSPVALNKPFYLRNLHRQINSLCLCLIPRKYELVYACSPFQKVSSWDNPFMTSQRAPNASLRLSHDTFRSAPVEPSAVRSLRCKTRMQAKDLMRNNRGL